MAHPKSIVRKEEVLFQCTNPFDKYILKRGEIFLCALVLHLWRFSVNLIIGLHLFSKISENECQLLTMAKTNGKNENPRGEWDNIRTFISFKIISSRNGSIKTN